MAALILIASLVTAKLGTAGLPCLFRLFTGVPCPGCGMWRSLQAAWHGNLLASLRFHPLGIAFLAGCLAVAAFPLRRKLAGAEDPFPTLSRPAWIAIAAVVLGLWLYRLTDHYLGPRVFQW